MSVFNISHNDQPAPAGGAEPTTGSEPTVEPEATPANS